jgi:hypothetical protein
LFTAWYETWSRILWIGSWQRHSETRKAGGGQGEEAPAQRGSAARTVTLYATPQSPRVSRSRRSGGLASGGRRHVFDQAFRTQVRVAPSYMIPTNLRPAIPNPVLASCGPWPWPVGHATLGRHRHNHRHASELGGWLPQLSTATEAAVVQGACICVWVALPLLVLNSRRHTPSSECF